MSHICFSKLKWFKNTWFWFFNLFSPWLLILSSYSIFLILYFLLFICLAGQWAPGILWSLPYLAFTWVLGILTQVLMLVWQALLSSEPFPQAHLFFLFLNSNICYIFFSHSPLMDIVDSFSPFHWQYKMEFSSVSQGQWLPVWQYEYN